MAKNKKTRRRRASTRSLAARTSQSEIGEPKPGVITMESVFGKVEVPVTLTDQHGAGPTGSDDEGFYVLELVDCEAELSYVSPRMARRALVEAEGLDPFVADQLAHNFPVMVPTLILRGDRGRLLAVAPMVRRVRRVALYHGDTRAALMGKVYDLPRLVLAEFQNGAAEEEGAAALAGLFEKWSGRLLILLVAHVRNKRPGAPLDDGQVIAAHEVELERPVLWHLGERGDPT